MRPENKCVEFCFTPSHRFRLAIATLHGLAALVVIAGPFPAWAFALLPLVALSSWRNGRVASMPVRLRCSSNEWFLIPLSDSAGAEPEPLSWLPSTRIGPRLTLLHGKSLHGSFHGKSTARRYFWPVAGDSLPADEFRRLRVWVGLAGRASQRSGSD